MISGTLSNRQLFWPSTYLLSLVRESFMCMNPWLLLQRERREHVDEDGEQGVINKGTAAERWRLMENNLWLVVRQQHSGAVHWQTCHAWQWNVGLQPCCLLNAAGFQWGSECKARLNQGRREATHLRLCCFGGNDCVLLLVVLIITVEALNKGLILSNKVSHM